MRPGKFGWLSWLATVSRHDVRARPAQSASKLSRLQGSDVYRINDPPKTAKERLVATVLKLDSRPGSGWALALAGRSAASYGDQTEEWRRRSGFLVGPQPSSPRGACHILQRLSRFTRKSARSSSGGEVQAFSKKIDYVKLRGCYAPFAVLEPEMAGLQDCEGLPPHLLKRKMVSEKYFARRFLPIQNAAQSDALSNANWLPGQENPADVIAEHKRDMVPLSAMLRDGDFSQGGLRQLGGVATSEPPRESRGIGGR